MIVCGHPERCRARQSTEILDFGEKVYFENAEFLTIPNPTVVLAEHSQMPRSGVIRTLLQAISTTWSSVPRTLSTVFDRSMYQLGTPETAKSGEVGQRSNFALN